MGSVPPESAESGQISKAGTVAGVLPSLPHNAAFRRIRMRRDFEKVPGLPMLDGIKAPAGTLRINTLDAIGNIYTVSAVAPRATTWPGKRICKVKPVGRLETEIL
jgi:hypothetical protein